ncbi:MAG: hypothetical protein IT328_00345 [Caldilineaceae bacterium]|nr:hypothetical protein [Caldilineaceae bacterium]
MAQKGEAWNESEVYHDRWTLREVRRITTSGLYNQTPTYHTNVCFTEDGEFLIFGSAREGKSAIFRAHVSSGDITQLIESVDGVGGYAPLHKQAGSSWAAGVGNGMGVNGAMCIAPRSRWAVFTVARTLRAVHIETLEERTLIEDIGQEWVSGIPSIDLNEAYVTVPLVCAHPEVQQHKRASKPYMEHFTNGEMNLRVLQVPLAGGEVTTIYSEDGAGSAHMTHSPLDPDLLLIDRDFPPRFWGGSDGSTNRIWTLRPSTGALTELPSQDDACFQVHSVWSWDGEYVLYHGRSAQGGYYIGAIRPDGESYREYGFYGAPHYGHVSAMAGRPAIILDGNMSPDMLLWLYYDREQPRVEVIARHGTDWGALPGQYSHPHPHSDPTGRWISFNAAQRGRSDVFVVKI